MAEFEHAQAVERIRQTERLLDVLIGVDCCRNRDWRGKPCSYHAGMIEGVGMVIAALDDDPHSASEEADR